MVNVNQQSAESFNPFVEQSAGRYFVGREEQLSEFVRALEGLKSQKPGHLYVAGVHGTGKTSYLVKLIEISGQHGVATVLTTFDYATNGRQQIESMMRAVVGAVEKRLRERAGPEPLSLGRDWDSGQGSQYFRVPRSERLQGDDVKADLEFLSEELGGSGSPYMLICVDEGQRIEPFALSALKNALQHLDTYLVVLSLRLTDEKLPAEEAGRNLLNEKAQQAEDDFGASRFFVSGVPLGSFATEQEARSCIQKRLENNTISFPSEVSTEVVRISDRLPRDIISLSRDVYDLTANAAEHEATLTILNESFKRKYHSRYEEAVNLVGNLSPGDAQILQSLLSYDRPVTPLELANHIYPGAPQAAIAALSEGIANSLRERSKILLSAEGDDRYHVSDNARKYALELVLGSN